MERKILQDLSRGAEKELFRGVESAADEGTVRARTIAIWLGLFAIAIFVSQFGRPSQARQAEFLRGSAKVAALGKVSGGAGAVSAARLAEVKELAPAVYASRKYGVAWQYPRNFVLRKGANANLDLAGEYATDSAFGAAGGGVTLASVVIPGRVYAGTDFRGASLTARVNARVSEEGCGAFRVAGAGKEESPASSEVAVGAIDFSRADLEVGPETRERFFHVYENAACYEFAMRVTTEADVATSRVDVEDVFERLTEILTSVTIVPVRGGAEGTGGPVGSVGLRD